MKAFVFADATSMERYGKGKLRSVLVPRMIMKASYGDMLVIAPFEVINFLSKNLSVIKNEKDCISFMVDVEGKKHKVRIIHAWYEEDRRDAVKGKPVARRSKK